MGSSTEFKHYIVRVFSGEQALLCNKKDPIQASSPCKALELAIDKYISDAKGLGRCLAGVMCENGTIVEFQVHL